MPISIKPHHAIIDPQIAEVKPPSKTRKWQPPRLVLVGEEEQLNTMRKMNHSDPRLKDRACETAITLTPVVVDLPGR